jgi:5-methylcytosine-specific restriction endonuclease McrA
MEEFDRERRRFEKLKHKVYSVTNETTLSRPRIPENVRIEVWRRDGGKCSRCGSRENLEYDHIVPISQGGSNTARNIELLCEKCNRSKGANVA